jgi:hypothetical protein
MLRTDGSKGKKFRVTCADGMSEILNGEAKFIMPINWINCRFGFYAAAFYNRKCAGMLPIAKEYRLGGTAAE